MGTFTMPLKAVLDLEQDSGNGYMIGLDTYPIFGDGSYRDGLNRKIIAHYWNREIGQETISMFTFAMRRRMNEIMPYYNQLYLSTQIQFDPLATYNMTTVRDGTASSTSNRTGSETRNGTDTSNQSGTNNQQSRTVGSTLPQPLLAGQGDYASSATDVSAQGANSGTNTTTNTGSTSNTDSGTDTGSTTDTSTTTGFQGSAADLLNRYRSTLLNVDMMVIDDLRELFMLIWDNGGEMLPRAVPGLDYSPSPLVPLSPLYWTGY